MLSSTVCACLVTFTVAISLMLPEASSEVVRGVPFRFGRPWRKDGFLGRPRDNDTRSATNDLFGVGEAATPRPVADEWFEQKLDHFNPPDTRTWSQRYFSSGEFHRPDGPIFVMIGGEGEALPIWMSKGAWVDYAKIHGAYLFQLEHRYYGASHPLEDMTVKNMAYLTSEQALADLAYFIQSKKDDEGHPEFRNVPWIVFGGSYSGNLAAWARLKYPHLVYAAVASSAPLQAVVNFKDYFRVVRDALAQSSRGPKCVEVIQSAVQELEDLIKTRAGIKRIERLFKLCSRLDANNTDDVRNLFSTLSSNFAGVVQYNRDNREFEGAKATHVDVEAVCGILSDEFLGDEVDRYAEVNSELMKAYGLNCLDYTYQAMVDDLSETKWKNATGGRAWFYQTCTEFGYYQSSDSDEQPFGHTFPLDFSLKPCIDVFGPKFGKTFVKKNVIWSNAMYGGRNVQSTSSRILLPNGSIDPWHALGLWRSSPSALGDVVPVYMEGTAHCADMYPPSNNDTWSLITGRELIRFHLNRWIADFWKNQ